MHCKSFWIKASAKCINVNTVSQLKPAHVHTVAHTEVSMQQTEHYEYVMLHNSYALHWPTFIY